MRSLLKTIATRVATVLILPALASYWIRAAVMGRDRALEGSTQALSLVPGVLGQYLRRAFLARTIASCPSSATISFGTIFSQTGARIEELAYIGPGCFLGLVHVKRNVLVGSGVHISSGRHVHGIADPSVPIRDQPGRRTLVTIGEGSWIGSAAVIMADVGANSVIGAGAVVVHDIPANVIAAGVPARVVRSRETAAASAAEDPLGR